MQYKYAKRISIAILSTLSLGHTAAYAQDWGNVKTLQDFIGRDSVVTNATAIESSGLMKSQLAERPWSSTYWADMMGSVDRPYAQFNPSIRPSFLEADPSRAHRA
jgi:hypothetical protein